MSNLFKTVKLFFKRVYFPSWGRKQDGGCGVEATLNPLLKHQSTVFGCTDLQQLLTFKPTDDLPPHHHLETSPNGRLFSTMLRPAGLLSPSNPLASDPSSWEAH